MDGKKKRDEDDGDFNEAPATRLAMEDVCATCKELTTHLPTNEVSSSVRLYNLFESCYTHD